MGGVMSKYRYIDDMQSYVAELATRKPEHYVAETKPIRARLGQVGESVVPSGKTMEIWSELDEMPFVRSEGTMVAKDINGGEYMIEADTFKERYVPDAKEPGLYHPKSRAERIYILDEDIEFKFAGNKVRYKAGDILNVTDIEKGKFFAVSRDQLYATHKSCDAYGNIIVREQKPVKSRESLEQAMDDGLNKIQRHKENTANDFLEDTQKLKTLAKEKKLNYPIGVIKEPAGYSQSYRILKKLGVGVRPYAGRYILFDQTKAETVLKELGVKDPDGKVTADDLKYIETVSLKNDVDAQIIAQKLNREGVGTKIGYRYDGDKKIPVLNYHGTPQNRAMVYKTTGTFYDTKFENGEWRDKLAKQAGIKGDVTRFVFDTQREANLFKIKMTNMGIKSGLYGPIVVYFDKSEAQSLLKEMGYEVKNGDFSQLKKLNTSHPGNGYTTAMVASLETDRELLKGYGVKATVKGNVLIYENTPTASEYFSSFSTRRSSYSQVRQKSSSYFDDILSQTSGSGVMTSQEVVAKSPLAHQPYVQTPYRQEAMAAQMPQTAKTSLGTSEPVKMTEDKSSVPPKIKEEFLEMSKKAGVIGSVVVGVKKVDTAINTVKQKVVNGVASVRGGKQAIKAARTVSKVAKVGGPIATVLTAACDPKGCKEFIDDVANLRIKKIANEMTEGVTQIVMHPVDTGKGIYNMGKEAVEKRYEGAVTAQDYAIKTGEAVVDGIQNTADVLTHMGSKGFEALNAGHNGYADIANWTMGKLGSDIRLVKDTLTYDEYKKDPLNYVYKLVRPVTQSASTNLRSDDTVYTVLERGDTKAMKALIERGDNVNMDTRGNYNGNNYTPYNTAMGMAVSQGDMDMAALLYKEGKANPNGTNEATGDTTFMTILKETAPDKDCIEYYTGRPLDISKESEYSEKAKNNYRIGQALVDDMIQSGKLDINQENKEGKNAFLVAAETGNIAAITGLIEKGADTAKESKTGSNALHLCTHNQLMTKILLDNGVDANHVNNEGKTPLMTALEGKQNDMCVAQLMDATNSKGFESLSKSEKHAKLLDDWLAERPEVKLAIIGSENHPLKEAFANRYPDDKSAGEDLVQLDKSAENQSDEKVVAEVVSDKEGIQESQESEKNESNLLKTLAQSGQTHQTTQTQVQRDINQMA